MTARRSILVALLVVSGGLVWVASAWACTNLATLNLGQASGDPGASVRVTGSSFESSPEGAKPVVLHWDATKGAVVGRAKVDGAGNIATTVEVPAGAAAGYHVIVATQQSAFEPGHAFGTPARASFRVGSPEAASAAAGAGTPTTASVSDDGVSTSLIVLTVVLGLVGIGLFGAGVSFFVRETRRARVPGTVRPPAE